MNDPTVCFDIWDATVAVDATLPITLQHSGKAMEVEIVFLNAAYVTFDIKQKLPDGTIENVISVASSSTPTVKQLYRFTNFLTDPYVMRQDGIVWMDITGGDGTATFTVVLRYRSGGGNNFMV